MEQAGLLWKLQALVQEVYTLQNKEGLRPLAAHLKDLQENIKNGEEESRKLLREVTALEKMILAQEESINKQMEAVKNGKDKLYSSKGGSLKELLSQQQALAKMEAEVQKTENAYWETQKRMEDLKAADKQTKEIIKTLKLQYNEGVKKYNAEKNHLEIKIAELQLKQDEVKEKLKPETLKLFVDKEKLFPINPVAVLKGGFCTGCHISIPSHLALHIREGKEFYSCDNCGRILINNLNS